MVSEIYSFVNSLTKEQFHEKMLRGVALTPEFSKFADEPAYTTPEEKERLRAYLAKNGMPTNMVKNDESLLEAVKIISNRAMKVK